MLLQSTSRPKNWTVLSELIVRHSYSIPHVIDEILHKSDKSLMFALFKLQDTFISKTGNYRGWFFASVKELTKFANRSKTAVMRSRRRLKYMGLIDYRLGNWQRKKATQYRILIDPFYLADKVLLRVPTEPNTKTIANSKDNKQKTINKDYDVV